MTKDEIVDDLLEDAALTDTHAAKLIAAGMRHEAAALTQLARRYVTAANALIALSEDTFLKLGTADA